MAHSAISPSRVSAWTRPQLDTMPQDISLGVPLVFSTVPISHHPSGQVQSNRWISQQYADDTGGEKAPHTANNYFSRLRIKSHRSGYDSRSNSDEMVLTAVFF